MSKRVNNRKGKLGRSPKFNKHICKPIIHTRLKTPKQRSVNVLDLLFGTRLQ